MKVLTAAEVLQNNYVSKVRFLQQHKLLNKLATQFNMVLKHEEAEIQVSVQPNIYQREFLCA